MPGNGEEHNYASPPHLVMLSDAILGISDLAREVAELKNQIQLMRADFEQMARSMDEFQKQVTQIKNKTIDEMIKISGEALDERLENIGNELSRMCKELRSGGRRSHPRRQQTKSRSGLFSWLFRQNRK